jgi:hypothetical protein
MANLPEKLWLSRIDSDLQRVEKERAAAKEKARAAATAQADENSSLLNGLLGFPSRPCGDLCCRANLCESSVDGFCQLLTGGQILFGSVESICFH